MDRVVAGTMECAGPYRREQLADRREHLETAATAFAATNDRVGESPSENGCRRLGDVRSSAHRVRFGVSTHPPPDTSPWNGAEDESQRSSGSSSSEGNVSGAVSGELGQRLNVSSTNVKAINEEHRKNPTEITNCGNASRREESIMLIRQLLIPEDGWLMGRIRGRMKLETELRGGRRLKAAKGLSSARVGLKLDILSFNL
uniref:Uncharacterized protein n=1 Tax=Globodera rostochiensis TaxID=31243 RepID=A0A914HWV6_GLORO